MKSLLRSGFQLLAVFLLFVNLSIAQNLRKFDLIIKRDSSKIEALITEVDNQAVKYKKYSDQEGPLFSILKSDISSIVYGNGEVENFDVKAEAYFDEVPAPVIPYQSQNPVRRYRTGALEALDTEQLRMNYKFYLKKANSYKKLGLASSIGGGALMIIGVALMSNSTTNYYNGPNSGYDRAVGGAMLFTTGLLAGIPLTIVGFVKKHSYNKKALLVQEELRRRKAPLVFHARPGFDFSTQSAHISLRLNF